MTQSLQVFVIKLSVFLFIGLAFQTYHQPGFAEDGAELSLKLSGLIKKSSLPAQGLGLVVSNTSGQIIFNHNADISFTPASLTKIVTAAAILEQFPPGHQFITTLLSTGSIQSGVLTGDLYLKGGGDAGFVSESMWFLVNEFKRSGIMKINGDIYVDDSLFDAIRFDDSRDQERVDRAYDAPIGAMTFNWSAINVFVRPGLKEGDSAQVSIDPENQYVILNNKAKTSSSRSNKKATDLVVSHKGIDKSGKELVEVKGEIPINADEFIAYKSVERPEIWAAHQLISFLKQRGIELTGAVKIGKTPPEAILRATYKSRPVSEMVSAMMKFSNNYVAEIMTKNLAVHAGAKVGEMKLGVAAIKNYLKSLGISEADYVFVNPSGLSRKNKFRPSQLLKILSNVHSRFKIYPEFLSSLPIGGVDGTLKRRMNGVGLPGSVRAKTGHLAGVSGLGGYIGDSKGELYQFVFLFNGSVDDSYKAKDLFDKLVNTLSR